MPESAERIRQRAPEGEVGEKPSRVRETAEARRALDERGQCSLECEPGLQTHDDRIEECREIRRRCGRADDAPKPQRASDVQSHSDADKTGALSEEGRGALRRCARER